MAHQRIVLNQIDVFFLSLSIVYSFFPSCCWMCVSACVVHAEEIFAATSFITRERERLPFVVLEREREEEEGVCVLAGVRTVGGLAL